MSSDVQEHILCIGLACLDIISVCSEYPQEDSDQRCLEQVWQLGGNAANTANVLSLIGGHSEYFGTLAKSPELSFLQDEFHKAGVCIKDCVLVDGAHCPTSVVLINQKNGSRTIVHAARDLRELSHVDFSLTKLEETQYCWIHFEGRPNVDEIATMLGMIDEYNMTNEHNRHITTSVELEKTRMLDCNLIDKADYVFISKDFAMYSGCMNKVEAANALCKKCRPGATIICAWGEDGAIAKSTNGMICTSSIFPPDAVIDTCAAGDTFNAGVIYALSHKQSLQEALTFGCKLAGEKCGMRGLSGLAESMLKGAFKST